MRLECLSGLMGRGGVLWAGVGVERAVSASGVWWSGEKGVSGLESGLLIWVLCLLLRGLGRSRRGVWGLALRALGGVWSACAWGVVGFLWVGAEECCRWNGGIIEAIILGYLLFVAV